MEGEVDTGVCKINSDSAIVPFQKGKLPLFPSSKKEHGIDYVANTSRVELEPFSGPSWPFSGCFLGTAGVLFGNSRGAFWEL